MKENNIGKQDSALPRQLQVTGSVARVVPSYICPECNSDNTKRGVGERICLNCGVSWC